jgi:L-histidine N-alpha-methyltransferase
MVAFLGSTIGNLTPGPRGAFLDRLRRAMSPGDWFLLGADLVKDPDRLVRAYDDAAGVTAAFNKNVLDVLARELDADLDSDDFEHVAVWDDTAERVEMRLRARRALTVPVRGLGLEWQIAQGEEILTETSAKFRVEGLRTELAAAGFAVEACWTDEAGDFSLTLARRA